MANTNNKDLKFIGETGSIGRLSFVIKCDLFLLITTTSLGRAGKIHHALIRNAVCLWHCYNVHVPGKALTDLINTEASDDKELNQYEISP